MPDLLTARQAAEELGLNYHTFLSRVRKGKIKGQRYGWSIMFSRSEIDKQKVLAS